jgi:hypothetical protein
MAEYTVSSIHTPSHIQNIGAPIHLLISDDRECQTRQVGNEVLYSLNVERSVLPENVKFFLLYFCTTTPFLLLPKLAGILQGIALI